MQRAVIRYAQSGQTMIAYQVVGQGSLDLVLISGVQSRMVYHLAQLYGQPLTANRFMEVAGTLGFGLLFRQATRGVLKFIPGLGTVAGSVAAGALAGASTFALGKAFCYYYQAVHQGHVPKAEDLRRYYHEQLALAEKSWRNVVDGRAAADEKSETPAHTTSANT